MVCLCDERGSSVAFCRGFGLFFFYVMFCASVVCELWGSHRVVGRDRDPEWHGHDARG